MGLGSREAQRGDRSGQSMQVWLEGEVYNTFRRALRRAWGSWDLRDIGGAGGCEGEKRRKKKKEEGGK